MSRKINVLRDFFFLPGGQPKDTQTSIYRTGNTEAIKIL